MKSKKLYAVVVTTPNFIFFLCSIACNKDFYLYPQFGAGSTLASRFSFLSKRREF